MHTALLHIWHLPTQHASCCGTPILSIATPDTALPALVSWLLVSVLCSVALQEAKTGSDAAQYMSSTIVQTSAPRELGQLRDADGEEGFAAKAAAKVKAATNGLSNGHGAH